MYDTQVIEAFLNAQLNLYPEEVAQTEEEAREFLEDICAAVADSKKDVFEYLEDVGVDVCGMSEKEILDMPEVIAVGDGRYLILEI